MPTTDKHTQTHGGVKWRLGDQSELINKEGELLVSSGNLVLQDLKPV